MYRSLCVLAAGVLAAVQFVLERPEPEQAQEIINSLSREAGKRRGTAATSLQSLSLSPTHSLTHSLNLPPLHMIQASQVAVSM